MNQLIEAGQLTEEEAETFEHNNIILQALGTADTVQVDLTYVDLAARRHAAALLGRPLRHGPHRRDPRGPASRRRAARRLQGAHRAREPRRRPRQHHRDRRRLRRPGPARPRQPDGELAYKKYALPDSAAGRRRMPPRGDPLRRRSRAAPLSEEAQRESRRLKVGHTMVGIQFSLPDAVQRASSPGAQARRGRLTSAARTNPSRYRSTGCRRQPSGSWCSQR